MAKDFHRQHRENMRLRSILVKDKEESSESECRSGAVLCDESLVRYHRHLVILPSVKVPGRSNFVPQTYPVPSPC